MIIIAAAFLILFIVWVVRRTLRRIRRAAAARAVARGARAPWIQDAPPAEEPAPDGRIPAARPEEDEPAGPRLWGDPPGDERRAAGGGGRH